MAISSDAIWQLADAIKGAAAKPKQRASTATVLYVDEEGTPWVEIRQGDTPVPVEAPSGATFSAGDVVNVETSGGVASISANVSHPSVSADAVEEAVRPVSIAVKAVESASAIAHTIAQQARAIAEATDQHFFADINGVHVTEAEGDPTTEHNILINSLGILLRHATDPLVSITQSAIAFYDGLGSAAGNIVASFGANGAQIGKSGATHTDIDANGMRIYAGNGTTTVADLGYGVSKDESGQTSDNPYYTLGTRKANSTIGAYSLAQGGNVEASGFESHAEGIFTTASGDFSHAEGAGDTQLGRTTASGHVSHAEGQSTTANGFGAHAEGDRTTASGDYSHAEGRQTTASGDYAHAEGWGTTASDDYAHAMGFYTIAASEAQTAMGKYNVSDSSNTYALIIGNGDPITRSNAYAVRWDGTIETSQDAYVTSSPATVFTEASGVEVTEALYYRRGQVAMLTVTVKATTAKSGSWSVGTVASGKRPAIMTYGSSSLTAIEAVRLYAGGGASCIGTLAQDSSVTLAWTYVVA